MSEIPDVPASLSAAATAELAWLEGGDPRAGAVVPLQDADGSPVVAVPYAYALWARSLAAAGEVVLTVSDPRLSGRRWAGLHLRGRVRLVEDRDGSTFSQELLEQELRKHPPSRALADSLLLRRENWWYLPRLLLRVEVGQARRFVERLRPEELLLVTGRSGRVEVDAVRVQRWEPAPWPLEALGPEGEGRLNDAHQALLIGHDFTVPDMERWTTFRAAGFLRGGALHTSAPAPGGAARMPGLMERLRRHRDLRRACLAHLRGPGEGDRRTTG